MTEAIGPIDVVRVHIAGTDVVSTKLERNAAPTSYTVTDSQEVNICAHSPNRCRTTITVKSGDGFLCDSAGDAQAKRGARVTGGQVLPLTLTSELWAIADTGSTLLIGVIPEYEGR